MRPIAKRRLKRYGIAAVIAAAPLAVLCAYVTNLLVPTEPLPRPASYSYIPTAVINDSNETIGIADSDIYGLSNPDGTMDTAAIDRHLDEMQKLGVNTVRVLIPWADIQPVPPGQFPTPEWEESMWTRSQYIIDAAAARDMAILGVLNTTPSWGDDPEEPGFGIYTPPDPAKYAEWAATVAERFEGKVSAYEIWNEPNYTAYWTAGPDPEHYTEILKAAYDAINAVDPDATVVAGVLGTVQDSGLTMNPVTFVQRMYAAGAKGYFDALSIHPYSNEISFPDGLDPTNQWQTPLEQLIAIRQEMLNNGDEALKIWATEYGLSTTIKDEETQAEWVREFLDYWDDIDYAGPAFLYTLRDRLDTSTEEGSMGIFTYNWGRKLVADVIECATKGQKCPGQPDPGPDPVTAIGEAIAALFQQLFNALTQNYIQAVATAVVNAISEALTNLFSGIFNPAPAIAAVPAETRLAVADAAALAADEVAGEPESTGVLGDVATDGLADSLAPEPEVVDAVVDELPEPVVEAVVEPVIEEVVEVIEPVEPEVVEPVVEEDATEPEVVENEEPTTVEEVDPATPGSRDESEDDLAVEPDDEETTGDEPETVAETPTSGKHAAGNVDNGVSVQDIQDRLDREATTSGPDGTDTDAGDTDTADGDGQGAAAA